MSDGVCGRCFVEGVDVYDPPCDEKPENVNGAVGMYHCPDCGAMQLAGLSHIKICGQCVMEVTDIMSRP